MVKMLPPEPDPYHRAIRELQSAADGTPTGFDFSELAEIALVRVTLTLGHAPETQTHLRLAIRYLESAMARALPPASAPPSAGGTADRPGALNGPGQEAAPARRPSQRRRPIHP